LDDVGILVDVPLLKGVDWLDPSAAIFVSDLEAWEQYADVHVEPGGTAAPRSMGSLRSESRPPGALRVGVSNVGWCALHPSTPSTGLHDT